MRSALARLGLMGLSLAAVTCGEAGAATDLEWVTVTRGDLAFEVDVTGTLTAAKSAFVGPPSASEERDFKISRMVAEGTSVKKGDKVIWFDVGDLARELL